MAEAGLGQGAEAMRCCERAVELLPVSREAAAGPLYLYVLARTQARLGQEAAAFATLDRMFGVPGFYNETWLERDPGFPALRKEPSFAAHFQGWSLRKGDCAARPPGAP